MADTEPTDGMDPTEAAEALRNIDPEEIPLPPDPGTLIQHVIIGLTANIQVMASNVTTMARTMGALGIKVDQKEKRDLWRWISVAVVVVVAAIFISQNRQTLSILVNATGPAAQAKAAQAQADAIQHIDCDEEANLIIYTSHLRRVVPDIDIPEFSPECTVYYSRFPKQRPTLPTP